MTIGAHIAMLRKSQGLTQTELAERLHAHQSIVNRWERDHVVPRKTTLEKLAQALETTVDELRAGPAGGKLDLPSRSETAGRFKDERLGELINQMYKLRTADLDALTTVIDAMLVRSRVQEAIGA
jgi:transcriptional regulator with XRE-family HTH domain